jgi:selenocysteine lyase/cysteine desulfurase
LNLPGIYGLNAALHWLEEQGIAAIRERERRLSAYFLEQLQAFPEVRILGTADPTCSTAVISLDFLKLDHAEVAFRLDHEYGIMTRCGLHCAPNAHKILGTYPKGTVRFSFGAFNTPQEIDRTIAALWQLMKEG